MALGDDSNIPGTYLYQSLTHFVVVDPDGRRWAFSESGDPESAGSVVFEGERISAEVPDWVGEKARLAREELEARERWEQSDEYKRLMGKHRPLSEMPVITHSPRRPLK